MRQLRCGTYDKFSSGSYEKLRETKHTKTAILFKYFLYF